MPALSGRSGLRGVAGALLALAGAEGGQNGRRCGLRWSPTRALFILFFMCMVGLAILPFMWVQPSGPMQGAKEGDGTHIGIVVGTKSPESRLRNSDVGDHEDVHNYLEPTRLEPPRPEEEDEFSHFQNSRPVLVLGATDPIYSLITDIAEGLPRDNERNIVVIPEPLHALRPKDWGLGGQSLATAFCGQLDAALELRGLLSCDPSPSLILCLLSDTLSHLSASFRALANTTGVAVSECLQSDQFGVPCKEELESIAHELSGACFDGRLLVTEQESVNLSEIWGTGSSMPPPLNVIMLFADSRAITAAEAVQGRLPGGANGIMDSILLARMHDIHELRESNLKLCEVAVALGAELSFLGLNFSGQPRSSRWATADSVPVRLLKDLLVRAGGGGLEKRMSWWQEEVPNTTGMFLFPQWRKDIKPALL